MTPQDALAKAIHVYLDHHDDDCGCDDEAATLVPLLADGWTVARTQDARDGEALRLLREASPVGSYLVIESDTDGWSVSVRDGLLDILVASACDRPTIEAAADACRADLEATR